MIINRLANIVNDFILNLYSLDIKFYQIIIGMFVFDFILYSLINLIYKVKYRKY